MRQRYKCVNLKPATYEDVLTFKGELQKSAGRVMSIDTAIETAIHFALKAVSSDGT
jgi:hypothetical protein